MKRLTSYLAIIGSAALAWACTEPTGPQTGAIELEIVTLGGAAVAASGGTAQASGQAALDSGRVSWTGPANGTMLATPGQPVTISDLPLGAYALTLQGWNGDSLTFTGATSGVTVDGGATTTAPVLFAPTKLTFTALAEMQALGATATNGGTVTYVTSNAAIATVDGAGLVTAVGNGTATITASTAASTAAVAVTVAQAVTSVTVTPPTANISAGATQQFTATALDANANPVPNVNILWVSSNHSVATVDQTGLATGRAGGVVTISAAGRGEPGSAALTVAAPTIASMAFTVQPSNAGVDVAISPAIQLELRDANGTVIPTQRDAVTLSIANNPGTGKLLGTKTVNATGGVVSFSGISLDEAGVGYTLLATHSGGTITATSAAFDIAGAGVATKVVFTSQPASNTAGAAFPLAIEAEIQDANNNRVDARVPVTLAFVNNAGSGTLSGTVTVNSIDGVAIFAGNSIDKAATGYTLGVSSGALTGATSTAFNISASTAARLAFATPPSNTPGNEPFPTTVNVTDNFGNLVTSATDGVTMEIERRPALAVNATLLGTVSVNAVAGVASFADLRIDVPGSGYELRARSGALTQVSSAPFNVSLSFTQVAAGRVHTCGVTTNGSAYCWGNGSSGQLGNGKFQQDSVPVLVSGGLSFTSLSSTTYDHTCGVTAAQNIYCWGRNSQGQLGTGTAGGSLADPQLVVPATATLFTQVATGLDHSCALSTVQEVWCWGDNSSYGQLGDGTTTDALVPVKAGTQLYTKVTAGYQHTCAIRVNDQVYCWGRNSEGQIGIASVVQPQPNPVLVSSTLAFGDLTSGWYHNCAVTLSTQLAYCWGYNAFGQVGNSTFTTTVQDEVQMSGQLAWTEVSGGGWHTCLLNGTSNALCVGRAAGGALGNGTTTPDLNFRAQVSGTQTFTALAGGELHHCGLTSTGQVWCWGEGSSGQLGNGTRIARTTPGQIIQN